jgi:DNA-binding NtrC family response regulator
MTTLKQIVIIGNDLEERSPALIGDLRGQGFQVTKIRGTADLAGLLKEDPQVTVLTYDQQGKRAAEEALRAVGRTGKKAPVVVLVEHGSFEDYYDLMCEGAYDYFEVEDNPEVIERAVRWAAGTRAGRAAAATTSN